MKNIILIALFCSYCCLLKAHNLNSDNMPLRQWSVNNQQLEGSFLMFKNGYVYLENGKHHIVNFPITVFSENDRSFIKKRQTAIYEINNQWTVKNSKVEKSLVFLDFKPLLFTLILIFTCAFLYAYSDRKKLKYLLPVILTGVVLSLYGFTTKVLKAMSTVTNPLFIDSAFTPFKPNVYTRWDATYFYVESKGIPSHPMMAGITGWQQQFPIPQCYTGSNAWSIPLNPVKATTPVPVNPQHFLRGAIAIAANGVAIFNPYTNTGVDALLDGQLDNYGGHCGRADDYHYHIAPLFLDNQTSDILPIAFALDGYAIYGSKEPDGSNMQTLDANHGHSGTNGIYHYHGTPAAPYMIANMVGKVTEDTTLQIIPQAHATPIRPAGTPLKGAVITNCKPNANGNGYTLTYTLSGGTDSVEYSWNNNGVYTFNYYVSGVKTNKIYNGFKQCNLPLSVPEVQPEAMGILIYPNPASTQLNLQLTGSIVPKDIQSISIFSVKGDLIYTYDSYKGNIDIRNLAEGLYIVKIQLKDISITKKIMVE